MKYVIGFLILVFTLPLFSQVTGQSDSVFANRLDSAVLKMSDRSLKARIFAGYLADEKDKQKAKYYYNLLKRDYADIPSTKDALIQFDLHANSAVQVGKQIPSFEISLLGGLGTVSDKSMLGKYYLLHFWATWMGCATAEIPYMSKAYRIYKGKKDFQIISVSFDESESKVTPFYKGWILEDRWKMPWFHAFAPGVFNANGTFKSDLGFNESDLGKKFEISGLPRLILVGPDGKILALNIDLRAEQLEETLGKYLGEGN